MDGPAEVDGRSTQGAGDYKLSRCKDRGVGRAPRESSGQQHSFLFQFQQQVRSHSLFDSSDECHLCARLIA